MKKYILFFIAFQFLFFTNAFPQTSWDKYEGNPVLEPGPAGSWDSDGAMACSILFDGDMYHMWYSGFDGIFNQIGHATSPDGIDWTKDPNNPVVEVGQAGSWEESHAYIPNVLLINSVYHMWYDGAWGYIEKTGHATSTDGSNWTKDPLNPVLDTGPSGSWDDFQVFPMAGSVIFEDNIYKMWYGGGSTAYVWQVGYATSPDGSVWTKDEANNPVITPGVTGKWDDYGVIPGAVLLIGNTYNMWFSGCHPDNWWRVGHATSTDGINWTKYEFNPVLDYGAPGEWDVLQAWCPSVIYDDVGDIFKMWYSGGDYTSGKVGYATSENSQIIHVPGDYPTIQAGIDAASSGNTVLVDEGTYYENINFKGKAITVASLFWDDGDTNHINNTIIDGSKPLDPDTASVVRFVNGEDTTSVIYGFTITGGKGTNLQPVINYRAGGGILCWNSGAKIISNYIVYDSLLTDIQGIGCGIYGGPNGSNSYLLIENNKIQNNYIYSTSPDYFATGAGIGTDCHCIIKGNNISYNTSIAENWRASAPVNCRGFNNNVRFNSISENIINHNITISRADFEPQVFGGAIYIMYNYGNISNNEIKYNEVAAESSDGKCTGSGITLLYMDESFIVSNNIISYNKFTAGQLCWGGGLLILYSTPKVFNNIISNNEATNGGGIGVQGSGPEYPFIVNNTIVENIGSWGGGMWIYEDSTIILNNIIYNNTALVNPAIFDAYGTTKVNYSDIEGGWLTGEGNIDVDPNFIDELYHLDCYSSQCINAGTDEIKINGITYMAPLFDFDGEPRPQDGYFDIGADEEELCTAISELIPPENILRLIVTPNPTTGIINLKYELKNAEYVTMSVLNTRGELQNSYTYSNQTSGEQSIKLNLSHLTNGLYLIRLQAGNQSETTKIILLK